MKRTCKLAVDLVNAQAIIGFPSGVHRLLFHSGVRARRVAFPRSARSEKSSRCARSSVPEARPKREKLREKLREKREEEGNEGRKNQRERRKGGN